MATPEARRTIWGQSRRAKRRVATVGLDETALLQSMEAQAKFFEPLSEAARSAFEYAFSEMVNNAIEHSGATAIDVAIDVDRGRATFVVSDPGVGVFENIRAKKALASELEAIQDLLKGKQTTMPEQHSGEGIFFTSKIADRFVLESHRKRLLIDNLQDDLVVESIRFRRGTRVTFTIDAQAQKSLFALMHRYTNEDYQFDRTHVTIRLFMSKESYVSRSQARRLLHALEQFQRVTLDFQGVPSIGQAFADEIFRVFQGAHPEIVFEVVNCNENVEFMIRRAKASETR